MTNKIKLGIYRNQDLPLWMLIKEKLQTVHIDLEFCMFYSFDVLNMALQVGDIDVYPVQCRVCLARDNLTRGYNLTVLSSTYVEPWEIISKKIGTLDDLKKRGNVLVIPADKEDLGRALNILQDLKLIHLKKGAGYFANLNDIEENPYGLVFITTALDLCLKSLSDPAVTACIAPSELDDLSKADTNLKMLFCENFDYKDKPNYPFMGALAVREDQKSNSALSELVKALQFQEAISLLREIKHGHVILGFDAP